jgi:hypothetical protein
MAMAPIKIVNMSNGISSTTIKATPIIMGVRFGNMLSSPSLKLPKRIIIKTAITAKAIM